MTKVIKLILHQILLFKFISILLTGCMTNGQTREAENMILANKNNHCTKLYESITNIIQTVPDESDSDKFVAEEVIIPEIIIRKNESIFEFIDVDYILVTNASGTIEPTKLREGENFLGLTLESVEFSTIITKNDIYIRGLAIASFSGDLMITGDLTLWEFPKRVHAFRPHYQYFNLFPSLLNDVRVLWFAIRNDTELLEMIKLEGSPELEITLENISIKINNFVIVAINGGGFNKADILLIINGF